jgi:hypothetical protein
MPITVRVQHFQSIEDATVVIDGFTVVTGPNNSGKTALMRAVRGVFLNSPAGPLVRRGSAHLTVTITYDDGTIVVWEKGWEKPAQKGKTINRYTIDGRELADVGRGCPPEVLALGINPIKAGTSDVWPQIADQFTGVLFLVGSPGSATAEAIANVDRVGKLSAALRLSEKERRQGTSKLNVRREDEKDLETEATTYEGVDLVASTVKAIEDATADTELLHDEIIDLETLRTQWSNATTRVEAYQGIEDVPFVEQSAVDDAVALQKELNGLQVIQTLYGKAKGRVTRYEGIDTVTVPDAKTVKEATTLRDDLATHKNLYSRLTSAKATLETYAGVPELDLPEPKRLQKMKSAVAFFKGLQKRRDDKITDIADLEEALRLAGVERSTTEQTVTSMIDEIGECPTCGVVAGPDGVHRHEEVA